MSDEATREARARARSSWPIRRLALADDDGTECLGDEVPVEDRLGMMWELARRSWALAGLAIPDYDRAAAPGRLLRPDRPR